MGQSRTSRKTPQSRKSSNKIYKITDNDVTYTLITASRDELRSFYSNKKNNRTTRSAAQDKEHASVVRGGTILPNSENSGNGTENYGVERMASALSSFWNGTCNIPLPGKRRPHYKCNTFLTKPKNKGKIRCAVKMSICQAGLGMGRDAGITVLHCFSV